MKTCIIHGQSHIGVSCTIARKLQEKVGGEFIEFFLPKDFDEFCTGCNACFTDENKCPNREKFLKVLKAMEDEDLIILSSPVYVFQMSCAMKNFLDHTGYMWMVHRPNPLMFKKKE